MCEVQEAVAFAHFVFHGAVHAASFAFREGVDEC